MAPLPILEAGRDLTSRSIHSAVASLAKRLPTSSTSSTSPSLSLTKRALLFIRQNTIIPAAYGSLNTGPAPGTVVGIVLGSVGGFLLILWLIYTCLNFNTSDRSSYTESVVVREHRKSKQGSHRSTRRASETIEIRRDRSRTPVRIVREESRRPPERVIVEERRETRRERADSRSRAGSDEVVVIEEHSPPRRAKSKRESRGEDRRDSGFRTVDPLAYGGVIGGRKERR